MTFMARVWRGIVGSVVRLGAVGVALTLFTATAHAQYGTLMELLNVDVSKFAVDAARNRVYASVPSTNSVLVLDGRSAALIATIPVGPAPEGLAISLEGGRLFVATSGQPMLDIVDLDTLKVSGNVYLPTAPYDVAVGRGNRVYVTPVMDGGIGIMQVDGITGQYMSSFSNGVLVYNRGLLAMGPDRASLYFANTGVSPGTLAKFDITMSWPVLVTQNAFGSLGSNGQDLALSADGEYVSYAVGGGNGGPGYVIHKLRASDFSVVGSYDTGAYPREVIYSPDGARVYTVHGPGQVDAFDAVTFASMAPIVTMGEAHELAVDDYGRFLFAAAPGSLQVYSLVSGTMPLPWLADPALQACLQQQAMESGWQFAEDVRELTCAGRGVQSLGGIEMLPELVKLDVHDNSIVDVFPLQMLTKLRRLDVSGNVAMDPWSLGVALSRMTKLTHLSLAGLNLIDLNNIPLREVTGRPYGLVELDVSNTQITTLSNLYGFQTLGVLKASGNRIQDWSALGGMGGLYHLEANDTGLTALGMLPVGPGLLALHIADNTLLDIGPLNYFSNLMDLDLADTGIEDLSPLMFASATHALTRLNLAGNGRLQTMQIRQVMDMNPNLQHLALADIPLLSITSLSWFNPATGQPRPLKSLNLHNTRLSYLGGLGALQTLTVLDISDNRIHDLIDIGGLMQLEELNVARNPLGGQAWWPVLPGLTRLDVSFTGLVDPMVLGPLTRLTHLNLSGNTTINPWSLNNILAQNPGLTHLGLAGIAIGQLQSLPLFNGFTGQPYALVELDVSNTGLTDAYGVMQFRTLKSLNMSGNALGGFGPTFDLPGLQRLDLSSTSINNVWPLAGLHALRYLNLSNNPLALGDVNNVLLANPSIDSLYLDGIAVGRVQDLMLGWSPNGRLRELSLANAQLTDLLGVGVHRNLRVLNVSHNPLGSVGDVQALADLRSLDLGYSGVTDIGPLLGGVPGRLRSLSLAGDVAIPRPEVDQIVAMNPNLTHLNLSDLPRPDIWTLPIVNPATGRTYPLVEFRIDNAGIGDAAFFGQFYATSVLSVRNNQITNVTPFMGLAALKSLDLTGNNQVLCPDLDQLVSILGADVVVRPTLCTPLNTPPSLNLVAPINGTQVVQNTAVVFTASSVDMEEGDLSARVTWTSSRDGYLGTGATLSKVLTVGAHVVTASVVDSQGAGQSANVNVTVLAAVSYCASKATSTTYEWIAETKWGSVVKTTGNNNGYGDFSTQTPLALPVGATAVTLTPGFRYGAFTEYWGVWVDFNRDGTFATTEQVYAGSGAGARTGAITVPATALAGPTRLRVSMRYGSAPGPCGTFTWGEVEDYAVTIVK